MTLTFATNKATILEIHNTTISNNKANGISDENGTFFNLNGIVNLADVQFINNEKGNVDNSLLMCLEDQIIISKAFDDTLLVDLPSSYDLRDYGLVTPVRDQGGSGSCWAFSTIAALESYLLKNENISYDLSENNMKNLMGIYGLNGTDCRSINIDIMFFCSIVNIMPEVSIHQCSDTHGHQIGSTAQYIKGY